MRETVELIERVRSLFIYDKRTGELCHVYGGSNRRVAEPAGYVTTKGYIQIKVDGVAYMAHRLIWMWVKGAVPSIEIDHRNGVKGDNRIDNLREATYSQNSQNQHRAKSQNSTGLLGAYAVAGRTTFRAKIKPSRASKTMSLGYFDTAEAAHEAYMTAKRRYHMTPDS